MLIINVLQFHASLRICKFLLGGSKCQKIKEHLPQVLLFFGRVRKQFLSLFKEIIYFTVLYYLLYFLTCLCTLFREIVAQPGLQLPNIHS